MPGVGFQHGPEFLEQVKLLYNYVTTEVFPDSQREGDMAGEKAKEVYINDGAPLRGYGGGGKTYTNDITPTPTSPRLDRIRLRAAARGTGSGADADLWYRALKSRMHAWQEQKQIMQELIARYNQPRGE